MFNHPSVLVVQDERDTRTLIRESLTGEQLEVYEVCDIEHAFEQTKSSLPGLIIVNMVRPYLGALDLCRWLRGNENTRDLPILIVSAEGGSADKVLGLECGADDYLIEPFRADELTARVKALLRRSQATARGRSNRVYRHGRLRIDFDNRQVFVDDREHYLPVKQFELLTFFVRNPGRVIGRQELQRHVWGNITIEAHTVDVALHHLRVAIEKNDRRPTLITTVRRVGYRFNPDG